MFAHIIVVAVGKVNNFMGFKKRDKATLKINIFKKMFLAFFIAAIIESVLFFVVGTSILAVYMGATNKESNFNIMKNFYDSETQKITDICSINKICYLPNALNVPG